MDFFFRIGLARDTVQLPIAIKKLQAVKVADILEAFCSNSSVESPHFSKDSISNAVGNKFHELRFYCFQRKPYSIIAFIAHLEILHVLP